MDGGTDVVGSPAVALVLSVLDIVVEEPETILGIAETVLRVLDVALGIFTSELDVLSTEPRLVGEAGGENEGVMPVGCCGGCDAHGYSLDAAGKGIQPISASNAPVQTLALGLKPSTPVINPNISAS